MTGTGGNSEATHAAFAGNVVVVIEAEEVVEKV